MIDIAIAEFAKDWARRSIICRRRLEKGLLVTEELHLKYFLAFFDTQKQESSPVGWFKDYSLIYDHGLFKFKPGRVLPALWNSSKQVTLNLINDIISFEKTNLSKGVLDKLQYRHMIQLKNLADWVCSKKLGDGGLKERKRIIAGDFKPVSHFTVGKSF